MKLTVERFGISEKSADLLVKEQLMTLEPLRQIDEAKVKIAMEDGVSPPFSIRVHLVTPGPDIFADARDHTLPAALAKVMKWITQRIKARAANLAFRGRNNLQKTVPERLAVSCGRA